MPLINYSSFCSLVSLFIELELSWLVVRLNEAMYSSHQHNAKGGNDVTVLISFFSTGSTLSHNSHFGPKFCVIFCFLGFFSAFIEMPSKGP